MIPAHVHISLEVLSSAGALSRSTVTAPGTHGEVVAGMQGIGVSTPIAAAVAAATCGLAMLWQAPNGMMFFMGMWSRMFAAGLLLVITLCSGVTTNVLGAIPNEHFNNAPLQTCCAIDGASLSFGGPPEAGLQPTLRRLRCPYRGFADYLGGYRCLR